MHKILLTLTLLFIGFFGTASISPEPHTQNYALPETVKQAKDWEAPEDYSPISAGTTSGHLTESSAQLSNGKFRVGYIFEGVQAQECIIELSSDDFDTFLILTTPSGDEIENDDVAWTIANTNSKLELTLPTTGLYGITVTSYRVGETGEYQLALSLGQAPPAPYALNSETEGALEEGDSSTPDGRFFDSYEITIEEPCRVTISLSTIGGQTIDTFLAVIEEGETFPPPEGSFFLFNDDYEGLNSQLTWSADPGTYQVIATSYSAGEQGGYVLTISGRGRSGHLAQAPDEDVTYWGIFCGINDYGGLGNLPLCREDAEKLYAAFAELGLMDDTTARVLVDREATPRAVARAFNELAPQMDDNDVFVFFYSGHGGRSTEGNHPEELDNRNEFLFMNEEGGRWLYDDELNALLGELPDETLKVIAIDACNSGGFERDIISAPNRIGFFSSAEDVLSLVASRFHAGGYLSFFFLEAVEGGADLNHNDEITAGELKDYLLARFASDCRAQTTTDSEETTRQQLVYNRGSVGPGRVVFTLDNE